MKPTPVNATGFGFVTTKLKVLVPTGDLMEQVNDFVIASGWITVSVARRWAPVHSVFERCRCNAVGPR